MTSEPATAMLQTVEQTLRFKALRAFKIGMRTIPRDSLIPLKLVFNILPELLSLGLLEEIKQEGESKWIALLVDYKAWIQGEIVDKDDIPEWLQLKKRGWAIEIYDQDLMSETVCGGCPKAFMTWNAAVRHRKATGHKRPYRKRKILDDTQDEV